jgi:hypothetical protein
MALVHSPQTVTNGLAFYYDMSNTQKSWRGAPTTNLIDVAENLLDSRWTREGGFGTVTANFGIAPDGSRTSTRLQYSGGYFYRATTTSPAITALTPGTTVTFSCWVKGAAQSGRGIGLWSYAVGGIVAASNQAINRTSWTRVSVTYTVVSGATSFAIMLAGDPGNIFQGDIEVWRPQLEVQGFATPYILGTRSNTQSIVDLTGINTITASNLTYGNDGTFSFNGSSNFINLNNNIQSGYTSASYEFWCRPTTLPGSGNYFQLYIQESSTWIALYNVGSGAFFGIDLNNGSGWFDNNGGSNTGARTNTALTSNTDYHVAYSWNGSTVSVYLNGNLQSTTSTLQAANGRQNVTQLGVGTTSRNIGSRYDGTNNNWVGTINSVRFYNRALTAAEVRQNFNALRGRYGI